jgi:hypothetical protein
MEDVLETCTLPYDPDRPVVCLDETSRQLVGETRTPLPVRPGQAAVHDKDWRLAPCSFRIAFCQ